MPGTARSFLCSCSSTCGIAGRSERGFRLMKSRPVLTLPPPPPPPTAAETDDTDGSSCTIFATRSCSTVIAAKEMSSDASVLAWIWPMSSSGKKPLGIAIHSQALATKLAIATAPITQRCRSAQSSEAV